MAVDDDAGEKPVGGELLPDHVGVSRQDRGAAVAEVRRQRCAGRDGGSDLIAGRSRVTDGDAHAGRHQPLDQRNCAFDLRRERHQHDAASRCLLPPLEIIATCGGDMSPRMRAARAVLRRDVRPLHVDAGNRRILDIGQDPCARREIFKRRRDEGRQQPGHTRQAELRQGEAHAIGRQVRVR